MRTVSTLLILLILGAAAVLCTGTAAAQPSLYKNLTYAAGVPNDGDDYTFLTKDSYETVKKFYKSRFVKKTFYNFIRDTVSAAKGTMGQEGTVFGYIVDIIEGENYSGESVEVWHFNPAAYKTAVAALKGPARVKLEPAATPPFSNLYTGVTAKLHTQAAFDSLVAKYEHVLHAYYHIVKGPGGKKLSERDIIITKHTESASKAAASDAWAEWVQCLDEMDKAGYTTKISIVGIDKNAPEEE